VTRIFVGSGNSPPRPLNISAKTGTTKMSITIRSITEMPSTAIG